VRAARRFRRNGPASATSSSPKRVAELTVCPVEELPPGEVKIVRAGELAIGVYNLDGEYFAIEDRCSHDDGPLAEGDFDPDEGVAICPRHGSRFDVRTGRPLSLPAYLPVETFEVRVAEGVVRVEVP
jgi:3-phenylpropionate/trans-cinnamate dioxygenase ferredoxin subunit